MFQSISKSHVYLLLSLVLLSSCSTYPTTKENLIKQNYSAPCNVAPSSDNRHFIVGYGSLMQKKSRQRTVPTAETAYPVEVEGFQRGWYTKGVPFGFSTTFLGIKASPTSLLNGVIYEVSKNELLKTDSRESGYCRQQIDVSNIKILAGDLEIKPTNKIWIYASHSDKIFTPSATFPIVQSYVDIFISGCLELQQEFNLSGFSGQCLQTTKNWSQHWVNDRIYPRRPFIYQPKAIKIDKLLKDNLPEYFKSIKIE